MCFLSICVEKNFKVYKEITVIGFRCSEVARKRPTNFIKKNSIKGFLVGSVSEIFNITNGLLFNIGCFALPSKKSPGRETAESSCS